MCRPGSVVVKAEDRNARAEERQWDRHGRAVLIQVSRWCELAIDERLQLADRCVLERRARRIGNADNQARHGLPALAVVEEHDALAAYRRATEDVAHLEADTVTRPGRFGDEHIAGRQPFQIARE